MITKWSWRANHQLQVQRSQGWHLVGMMLCIPLPLGWMPIWRKISLNAAFGAKKLKCRWPGPLGEVANRNFVKREQIGTFCPVCRAKFYVRCATLEPILGYFQVFKMRPSGLVGKPGLSTFQPNYNFWIWSSFSPPNLDSPKTSFCVSKKWQRGNFWVFFDL